MQHSRSFKPSVFLSIIVLATIACGLPTSFGGDASGSETATANSERATELAESINDLESQVEATQHGEQVNMDATATMGTAIAVADAATSTAVKVDAATRSAAGTATQAEIENATATATNVLLQATLDNIADAPGLPEDYSLIFFEPFDNNFNEWWPGSNESEFGVGNTTIEDGYLKCEFAADRGVFWHRAPMRGPVWDFYVSVDVQRISGEADGYYGLVFRLKDSRHFYTFEVDDLNQRYWVHALDDGVWYFVFSGVSSAIKYNEVNRLAVTGEGNMFTFYINGYRLGQAYDHRYEYGKFGVSIELPGPNNEAVWWFDNLAVYIPED